MRAELAPLVGVQSALEQRAEDGRVDFGPIERGRAAQRLRDVLLLQRQRAASSSNSPPLNHCHLLETHRAAASAWRRTVPWHRCELVGIASAPAPASAGTSAGQQPHILREHAEDESVDEMRDGLRIVAAVAQPQRKPGEPRGGLLGERLGSCAGLSCSGSAAECPFEQGAVVRLAQAPQCESRCTSWTVFVQLVWMLERLHVADDEERRVLQRDGVLLKLGVGRSRSLRLPLYSQAKQPRFHTSAQPSPPLVFIAPFSKAYRSPFGSASLGVGSSSRRHRSMKWDCAAARSVSSTFFHLAMNSLGVM